MNPISNLKVLFSSPRGKHAFPALPQPGVHHYLRQDESGKVRLHLRVEKDGHGMLLVNAARNYFFNPTATYMAYLVLERIPSDVAKKAITRHFNVPSSQADRDFTGFIKQFDKIISPDGLCPICDLELDVVNPFSNHPSAPYRMDLALTYRCNNSCSHCYNDRSRNMVELDTAAWKLILDRIWQIGIPHVVFTGGEPTLRSDLPKLIAHAEHNGQITGINTNGRKLKDLQYLQSLVDAGLDHVQITLESHDEHIHDTITGASGAWKDTVAGLKNALKTPLFTMTNTTLLQENSPHLDKTLAFLKQLGVPTVGLNALIYAGRGKHAQNGLSEALLNQLLDRSRKTLEDSEQRLIWYTPTQYCYFNPIEMNLGVKGCTAALYNMCIEPDGNIIPCQSYYQPIGNFLTLPWEAIWNHELAISLRQRRDLPADCKTCSLIQECGGGCPLARQAGRYADPKSVHTQFDNCTRQVKMEA